MLNINQFIAVSTPTEYPRGNPVKSDEMLTAEILKAEGNSLLLKIGDQQVVAQSSMPLAEGTLLFEIIGRNDQRLLLRPLSTALSNEMARQMITGNGLAVSGDRIHLARHALAAGLSLSREMLLQLESIWNQLDRKSAWLPFLMRLPKSKIPINKLSAMVLRELEHQTNIPNSDLIYIYFDLNTAQPQFSLHHPLREQEDQQLSERSISSAQTVMIGCDTPHLGPVLVTIVTAQDRTEIELFLCDEDRREFVTGEVGDLREKLSPIFMGLVICTNLFRTVEDMTAGPKTRCLDIRV